jgi:FAD/FMN-containing dehydrogenase
MSDIVEELRRQLSEEAVLDSVTLGQRARNYWDSTPLQGRALVRPASTEELSRVMSVCYERGQTVVVHGGLTGVCDADRSSPQDVVVSLERMNAIEEIDPVGRTATVQAGCRLEALQKAVEQQDLYFPLDLGARGSCTLGGNVATNAGGTNVIRFGMMRALVLGLEVVLPDGKIISSMNHMLKNNTGYDVKQLFIGSEGTLGIVTRMILTLEERSQSVNTVLVAVDRGEKLPPLLKLMDQRLGGTLSSFEAMWGDYFRAITAPGWHSAPMDRHHAFYVIVEAQGPNQADDTPRFDAALEEAIERGLIVDAVVPKSDKERRQLWSIREDFEALRQHKPLFLYDISLPIREMLSYADEVKASLLARWPDSQFFALGHIGDGNLHFFVTPGAAAGDIAAQHSICDEHVYRPLERLGGAVSAEHGIGLEKKSWMWVSRTAAELDLMRLLKRTLDPKNILNRGKVVDV